MVFARRLDEDLEQLGQELQVSAELARCVLKTQSRDERDPRRWAEEATLRKELRGRFHAVPFAVAAVAEETVRASSLVENLNSRLRTYFFLRRHLGPDYLALLQFYLNHRRLERSDRPQRRGKTPAELLTGQSHPHGLELLGYTLFRRAEDDRCGTPLRTLHRQGTLIVRTVTPKTPNLNQAGKWREVSFLGCISSICTPV